METETDISKIDDLPIVNEQIESVGKSAKNYLRQHPAFLIIGITFVITTYAVLFLFNVDLVQLFVLPIMLLLFGYIYLLDRIRHEFMRQFAAANSFAYSRKGSLEGLDGSLFQIGHNKSVQDVIRGNYHSAPLLLFTYTYQTQSGKESQTHNFTVFRFQVNANMPDILLENRSHEFGESLLNKVSQKVTLELEGDFNKYFSLYVPDGYEIEALQVLTPNIMVDLEEKCHSLSIEIVKDQLYLYKDLAVNSKKEIYEFYECAKYFEEKLAPILLRMKPALDDMAEVSQK
jgi:hypothetical protein